jgi:hypothetical protein
MQYLNFYLDLDDSEVRAAFQSRRYGVEQIVRVRSHEFPGAKAVRAVGTEVTSYDDVRSYRIAVTTAAGTEVDEQTVSWLTHRCEHIVEREKGRKHWRRL